MLPVCFSVAQMIAFLSSTDSTCSRCGITDITCCITEHILVNCNCVQTCKILFEECINREFDFTVSEIIYFLHGEEYVRTLFGLDPKKSSLAEKLHLFLMWLQSFSMTHGCNFVNYVHLCYILLCTLYRVGICSCIYTCVIAWFSIHIYIVHFLCVYDSYENCLERLSWTHSISFSESGHMFVFSLSSTDFFLPTLIK